jgi:hypothetical protein
MKYPTLILPFPPSVGLFTDGTLCLKNLDAIEGICRPFPNPFKKSGKCLMCASVRGKKIHCNQEAILTTLPNNVLWGINHW